MSSSVNHVGSLGLSPQLRIRHLVQRNAPHPVLLAAPRRAEAHGFDVRVRSLERPEVLRSQVFLGLHLDNTLSRLCARNFISLEEFLPISGRDRPTVGHELLADALLGEGS